MGLEKFRSLLIALVASGPVWTASTAHAQIAESAFDADVDGWLSVTLPFPSAVPIPALLDSFTPTWGNGFITRVDPDGTQQSGEVQYWNAPAKFLGDKGSAYGGSLSFALRDLPSNLGPFSQQDIILIGAGMSLVYDLEVEPPVNWTQYVVPLNENGWKHDSAIGDPVSQTEFQSVLASLSYVLIRAEYYLGSDTASLDNVSITAPDLEITNVARPSIKGAARVGGRLRATPGKWLPSSLSFTYRWYAGESPITGGASRTFLVKRAQLGKRITVRVTASASGRNPKTVSSRPTVRVGK